MIKAGTEGYKCDQSIEISRESAKSKSDTAVAALAGSLLGSIPQSHC